jgi:tRNA(Ile2) C34 agmatinyltransferase TiaS
MAFNINPSRKDEERRVRRDMTDNRFSRYDMRVRQMQTGNAQAIWDEYRRQLVCPKCAAVMAFTGARTGYCPRCHYEGESVTVDQFLSNRMYR